MDIFLLSWIIAAWLVRAGTNIAYAVRGKPPAQVQKASAKAALSGGSQPAVAAKYGIADYFRDLGHDAATAGRERRELGQQRRREAREQREKLKLHRQRQRHVRQDERMGDVPDEVQEHDPQGMAAPPDPIVVSTDSVADVEVVRSREDEANLHRRRAADLRAQAKRSTDPVEAKRLLGQAYREDDEAIHIENDVMRQSIRVMATMTKAEADKWYADLEQKSRAEHYRQDQWHGVSDLAARAKEPAEQPPRTVADEQLATVTALRRSATTQGSTHTTECPPEGGDQNNTNGGTMTPTGEITGQQSGIQHCELMANYMADIVTSTEKDIAHLSDVAERLRECAVSSETSQAALVVGGVEGTPLTALAQAAEQATAACQRYEQMATELAAAGEAASSAQEAYTAAQQALESHGGVAEAYAATGGEAGSKEFLLAE